ncbi:glycosyltransferase [Oscillochloris sp. ZM17-4]|uniref:glycosyltransferase n=1 Tax=Oscillochloris sp. ZM17-4 TaxID=2866714 RepID=UPI001C7309B9|nr:glycosyltransferase [Oscillochloris sp. ZM17-4]MBX0326652.1 glycosyltransferase [Oscillochloris sp. ZM17-4]
MQILFISADVPSQRHIRAHGMLSALAGQGHRISVVCGAAPGSQRHIAALRERGLHVVAVPQSAAERRWNALRAAPGPLPARAAAAFGPRLLEAARDEARGGDYDIAHVDGMAASALGCALIGVPAIIDAATCESLALTRRSRDSWRRAWQIAPELARTRRHEAAYIQSYDRIIAASAEDAWALGALSASPAALRANIHVVPTAISGRNSPGLLTLREQGTLLLCATPEGREAAIRQVADTVMPLIWSQRADIKLLVVGPLPADTSRGVRADPRILSVSADDWRAAARATIALAPGDASSADEALQTMGAGTPLIASRAIGRALRADGGRDLLLADGPRELAQAALDLLDDPRYRGQIGRAGRAYVERQHGPAAAADALERIYAAARGASIADWSLGVGLGLLNDREVGG